MKKHVLPILLVALLGSPLIALCASPADDAIALVNAAIDHFRAHGKEKTLAAINDPKGAFVKGELYVFVSDYSGMTLAHGGNNKLVGRSMIDFQDANGKYFMQMFIQQAKKEAGWVDYRWANPKTKTVQDKATYVVPVPELNALFGCGYYKGK